MTSHPANSPREERPLTASTQTRPQDHARLHWTGSPAGSGYSDATETRRYFGEVEAHRYSTHPWILRNIERFDIQGRHVLEIGYGMGTDHLALARQGGRMAGIDLAVRSRELTSERLALHGFASDLRVGEAEQLPFDDNSFDFVYSFGVVHHSPRTEAIISEIHRVLKPGGQCWVTVYHRWSAFFLWSVLLVDWVLRRGFRHESLRERVSRIEYPNDNPNLVVRMYSARGFRSLFRSFSASQASIDHLAAVDIALVGDRVPSSLMDRLARHVGWYVIVEAVK